MKYVYILKKGLQCYPPCLAQVLHLDDVGVDLTVYHGKNTDYINSMLDERNIEHHTFQTDKENNNKLQSYANFITYTIELKKILKRYDHNVIFWFGNCESAIMLGKHIKKYRFVLSVLELYELNSLYDRLVRKIINYAECVICCEKHRAVIMKDRYGMERYPVVIPNKPYHNLQIEEDQSVKDFICSYGDKKFVLYQGIIRKDRPVDNVARALKEIGDSDIYLVILGKANNSYQESIKKIYENTVFPGYVPAPQHLLITKMAMIGIAIYDDANLNNQFCAPNKIYEYSRYGIPIIASENLGLTETVGLYHAGKCLNFKDVTAIKNGLLDIIYHYDEYSDNAIELYKNTDCRKQIEDIVQNI